ncbi:MAG: TonB-dependent receptor [Muribaculaceae bacterium]|nr:TonB-dependent receptor [Muribaculaceae bacterium]
MKRFYITLIGVLVSLGMYADVLVTGTVYEPSGDTAIGATVMEKGQPSKGTATDIDGNFQLNVSSLQATLVVSYIGMQTQEVKLDGLNHIEVHLKDDNVTLDELVVVGYGTQKKINATGSVRTIDSEVLESRPVTNAVQGLQGAVAGLNITNDSGGGLGETMNINIRGVGSIGDGSNSSPLILIDGMEGDLSTINPNDIENISVLKDAAAASIYGSRAPFGVILVTTKGGKKGTTVNYNGNFRWNKPTNVPHVPDSYTYALMMNDAYINTGGNAVYGSAKLEKMKQFQAGILKYGTDTSAPGSIYDWMGQTNTWGNTNWYDVHLKNTTFSQEHNVSVSGGGDMVTYYFSGNYLGQDGLFRYADEKYQRLALTGKVNVTFNKYVQFLWTSRYIATDNTKPSVLNSMFFHQLSRMAPTLPLYTTYDEYDPSSYVQQLRDGGRQDQKTQQIYNQGNLTITPIKDWQIHADISSRIEHNPYTREFKPVTYTMRDGSSGFINLGDQQNSFRRIRDNGTFYVDPAAGESYYEKANTYINYFSTNFYTDYSLSFGENNFKFLLGVQTESYSEEITRVASWDILLPDTPFIPSDNGGGSTMSSESKGKWTSVGIFGRINYNYNDRYMAEVNLRGDGASRFPKNQRWGVFPSFSIGWNIANEKFWEPAYHVMNYFKLRASYGQLGNQNTTSFYPFYQKMYTTGGTVILGDNQATLLPIFDPYSTSLTWERIENVGAGVDFAFFNNRLQGSFDWYQRTTKDMIGPAYALAAVYGANAPKTNNAELRTRGWELELSWRDNIGKDFSYSISASLSDYQTVVTKYDSPNNSIDGWYQGKNYGEIWGYSVVGIAKSDEEMAAWLAQHNQDKIPTAAQGTSTWGGGDLMYADLNNDGSVDPGTRTLDNHGDLRVIGNNTPRYAYSFTLDFKWKFIDFRAYFQGIGKRDYFISNGGNIGGATFFGFQGGAYQNALYLEQLDYFRYAGAELGANFENPYYGRMRYDDYNTQCSDRFIQDASYLRLKNLQVGFSLPGKTPISKYVKKARIYFSAENLFTVTKLKIFDPEALKTNDTEYSGGAGKVYPQYRTFSMGLELTF